MSNATAVQLVESQRRAAETAPKPGCRCEVCRWARRRYDRDKELAENYAKYLAGELVSLDTKE